MFNIIKNSLKLSTLLKGTQVLLFPVQFVYEHTSVHARQSTEQLETIRRDRRVPIMSPTFSNLSIPSVIGAPSSPSIRLLSSPPASFETWNSKADATALADKNVAPGLDALGLALLPLNYSQR
jgi:hypothetical protein